MKITFTASSPISHGEFKDGINIGNMSSFRRISMFNQGKIYSVPVISGNAIRGVLRRILTTELVERYNLTNRMGKHFDKFYIAVANGGNLNKTMDVSVDTEHIRDVRCSFPLISVLGGSLYRYMLPGMVSIGFAIPKCLELGTGSIRLSDLTEDIGLVRHIERTIASPEEAKPMPYTIEAIVPGTEFDLDITFAPQTTETEKACICHGLKMLNTIGGKSSGGFGKISVTGYDDDTLYLKWLEHSESVDHLLKFAEEL